MDDDNKPSLMHRCSELIGSMRWFFMNLRFADPNSFTATTTLRNLVSTPHLNSMLYGSRMSILYEPHEHNAPVNVG